MRPEIPPASRVAGVFALCALGMLSGCATTRLEKARSDFYSGRLERADAALTPVPEQDKDSVLFLMERGMVRQALGMYDESAADWRAAGELNELLETYSVSRGAAGFLTSDRVLSFRGKPFERTLLFSFLANNYLAQRNWDYAAVCARNIILQLEDLRDFPDVAYGRYLAGFCLEMIGDTGNAALQYRTASDLLPFLFIDGNTGWILPETNASGGDSAPDRTAKPYELVCFVAMGRASSRRSRALSYPDAADPLAQDSLPYAEFYHDGRYLGRSYQLSNTEQLYRETMERMAALRAAKEVSRFAVKETISQAVERQDELLGFLARLTLFAFEAPDTRRWETLPLWLGVARIRLSEPPSDYTVVFRSASGYPTHTKEVESLVSRRGNIFISFCRDIPAMGSDPQNEK